MVKAKKDPVLAQQLDFMPSMVSINSVGDDIQASDEGLLKGNSDKYGLE